jgi:hypothetical protein
MADMTPQQVQELLQTLQQIANALQHIGSLLGSAHLNHWNGHLSQIASKTGR